MLFRLLTTALSFMVEGRVERGVECKKEQCPLMSCAEHFGQANFCQNENLKKMEGVECYTRWLAIFINESARAGFF
jgi:hypothetical protein